jgi:hypothetical protein
MSDWPRNQRVALIIVDDEDLSADRINERGKENNSRMCAFVAAIRLHVVLEVCSSVSPVWRLMRKLEPRKARSGMWRVESQRR